MNIEIVGVDAAVVVDLMVVIGNNIDSACNLAVVTVAVVFVGTGGLVAHHSSSFVAVAGTAADIVAEGSMFRQRCLGCSEVGFGSRKHSFEPFVAAVDAVDVAQ
jgi:hypothetical protein